MRAVDPTKLKTKLACFLEADVSTNSVWENRYRKIMKTILQEKVNIITAPQFGSQIDSHASSLDSSSKSGGGQGIGKIGEIFGVDLTKVRRKKEVIEEARTAGTTVHSASFMDICHQKHAELETKHQKYKGRVVLRGDIVKDNSGSYAVFTEQGSSASQMTAAKIMDIISRLPGCDGQAADAVSAYTKVKMEDAHKLLKIPKSECPDIWIRLPRHKWPKSWSSMEDPFVLLARNLYGHPLARLLWFREFEDILRHGWEKFQIGNVS